MKQLYPVKITPRDTCLTYACQRIGLNPDYVTMDNLDTITNLQALEGGEDLELGDVLYWENKAHKAWVNNSITGIGMIVAEEVMIGRHLAVFEGGNLVSDLTRVMTSFATGAIRIRDLDELAPPSIVYRRKVKQ